jgi:hypothetical protein
MSFPDKKLLKEWQAFMELAASRDHRKLGPVRSRPPPAAAGLSARGG